MLFSHISSLEVLNTLHKQKHLMPKQTIYLPFQIYSHGLKVYSFGARMEAWGHKCLKYMVGRQAKIS